MTRLGRHFSLAAAISLTAAGAHAWPAAPCAAPAPEAAPAPSGEFAPVPQASLTYPTFCAIPPKPASVETAGAYKAQVVRTRQAGAWLVGQTAPDTFSLAGTAAFKEEAIHEAKPPPPMTAPGDENTAAFVAKAKAKATPPHKPH
jgi:hypothetical protein